MFAVLRQRNFALLWCGGVVSLLGDWVLFVALPVYVYNLTGSALATGAMFIAQTAPPVMLGSVAGVFADRWNHKRTMVIADLSRAALLVLLLAIRSAELVWIVYPVVIAVSIFDQFFDPSKNALLPRLVDGPHLMAANSLNSMSVNLTRLVGPAIGGVLLGTYGFSPVILLDSASFLLSGLLIAPISGSVTASPVPQQDETTPVPQQDETTHQACAAWLRIWREWQDGIRLVRHDRVIAVSFLAMGTAMMGEGIFLVLLVVFVKRVLGGGAQEFGVLLTAQAVGGLIGSAIIGQVGRIVAPYLLVGLSGTAFGMIALVIFNVPVLWLDLALFVLMGLPITGFFVGLTTLVQGRATDAYRGRLFGALNTTTAFAQLVGMGLASAFASRFGAVSLLDVACGLTIFAGVVALVLLSRSMKGVDSTSNVDVRQAS